MTRVLAASMLFLVGGCALSACGSTREIETSPPQTRTDAPDAADGAAAQEAPLAFILTEGETSLHDDVSRLRLRVSEVSLRRTDGRWVRLPSDSAPLEFNAAQRGARRTLLDTRVAPVPYDSLAITFSDVFVMFGPNAGAPLTTAIDTPQQLSLSLEPARGVRSVLSLRLELGASLTRSPDCRWFFVPVLQTDLSATPIAPPGGGAR